MKTISHCCAVHPELSTDSWDHLPSNTSPPNTWDACALAEQRQGTLLPITQPGFLWGCLPPTLCTLVNGYSLCYFLKPLHSPQNPQSFPECRVSGLIFFFNWDFWVRDCAIFGRLQFLCWTAHIFTEDCWSCWTLLHTWLPHSDALCKQL